MTFLAVTYMADNTISFKMLQIGVFYLFYFPGNLTEIAQKLHSGHEYKSIWFINIKQISMIFFSLSPFDLSKKTDKKRIFNSICFHLDFVDRSKEQDKKYH